MNVTAWTPENVNRLRSLASAGKTATEIGQELRLTRSSVLGKAHREGISLPLDSRKRAVRNERLREQARNRKPRAKPSADWAGYRSRPKGGHAFTPQERLLAVAQHFAGLSMNRAAKSVGASPMTLRNWLRDPELADKARDVVNRAEAEAARQVALREAARDAEIRRVMDENEPILAQLNVRTATIIRRRCAGETLANIGADYGITRERVRQIVRNGIKRGIKAPPGILLANDTFGGIAA